MATSKNKKYKKRLSNARTHIFDALFRITHHHHHTATKSTTTDETDGNEVDFQGELGVASQHLKSTESEKHPKIHSVKGLLDKIQEPGFDVNELNSQGDAPIHCLIKKEFKKKEKHLKKDLLVALLTYSDADTNLRNENGETPLHVAVNTGDIQIVRILLAFGARINHLSSRKKTPLDLIEGPFRFQDVSQGFLLVDPTETAPSSSLETSCNHYYTFTSHFAKNGNVTELAQFLRQCGAERSRDRVRMLVPINSFSDLAKIEKEMDSSASSPGQKVVELQHDNWCEQLPQLFHQITAEINRKLSDVSYPLSQHADEAMALGIQMRELKMLREAGSRILFLDGGGMRGLIEIEILSQLEEQTGRRITELFDWIVGTSTGGIIALGLVYGKKTLKELRQLYYVMKDEVFGKARLGIGFNTARLEKLLKEMFGDIRMDEIKHPRVLVTAVYKKTINLKLHFFNNCFGDEISKDDVWKVARYTSAAPTFFNELDNYVDGGVLANNPASSGLTRIQNFYCQQGQRLPISLVVSIGTGKLPEDELGRIDAQDFLFFGKHWFNFKDRLADRVGNLATLLGNAITESEHIAQNVRLRCQEQSISYYRFSPQLPEVIPSGETDLDKLIDMVLLAKKCIKTQCNFRKLVFRFHQCCKANQKMSLRLCHKICT